MQFEGGYRYPSNKILLALTVVTLAVVSFIWWGKGLSFLGGASLLLGLEGTALLASAYSPVGLVPPKGHFFAFFSGFLHHKKAQLSHSINLCFTAVYCVYFYHLLLRCWAHNPSLHPIGPALLAVSVLT